MKPKYAVIEASASGDNTVVAAVTGKAIRVTSYTLVCDSSTACRWKSGASTNKSGAMSFGTQGGVHNAHAPMADGGVLQTDEGEALVLNLSAANGVNGHLVYWEVT